MRPHSLIKYRWTKASPLQRLSFDVKHNNLKINETSPRAANLAYLTLTLDHISKTFLHNLMFEQVQKCFYACSYKSALNDVNLDRRTGLVLFIMFEYISF